MKKLADWLGAGLVGATIAMLLMFGIGQVQQVHAQSVGPIIQYVAGTVSGCTVTSGQSTFCFTTGSSTTAAALYLSSVGGAFAAIGGGTSGVQKVNGTAPGATGNVTVGCTVAIPAGTATFTAGNSTSATIAAQTITATCTGTGS